MLSSILPFETPRHAQRFLRMSGSGLRHDALAKPRIKCGATGEGVALRPPLKQKKAPETRSLILFSRTRGRSVERGNRAVDQGLVSFGVVVGGDQAGGGGGGGGCGLGADVGHG
jgi:hypothetical protein